ncbi:MAG TPA: hypothetical protein VD838_17860, partial [Anaeromyxobacteraceae bacterium]|nr:hypothetical protein [Anaeromyxobacteraceae bacterium]
QAEGGAVGAEARSNVLLGAVSLRVGLPYELQLEAAVPFVHAQRDVTISNAFVQAREESGLGDVQAALTWQLARGVPRTPDVLLSARWKSRTGRSPYGSKDAIGLGSGLDELAASVTLVKPVDPLVLLASAEVAHPFARRTPAGHVDAREAFAFSVGAVLAVSPEASLTFGVDQRIAPRLLLNGAPVPGTDQMESSFRVGLSTAWSATSSLQVNVAMGLTRDVPQVQLSVAMPMQL